METRVLARMDKTMLRIRGVRVRGLKPVDLERGLADRIGRPVRVIGVTGDRVEMDVYGLEPESILKDSRGLVAAVSAVEGIQAGEVASMDRSERLVDIHVRDIPRGPHAGCKREIWGPRHPARSDPADG